MRSNALLNFARFSISMLKLTHSFLAVFIYTASLGQTIKVGLETFGNPQSLACYINSGAYKVMADGIEVNTINTGESIEILVSGNGLVALINSKRSGPFQEIKLRANKWDSEIRLRSISPKKNDVFLQDNAIFKKAKSGMLCISELELEKYVAGVVEGEAGKGHTPEYYKVQAIISRTYALANRKRHIFEGYNLCDKVHCQVYHGKARWEPEIPLAAWETKGTVIVDQDIELITAAFHSNCGGKTLNSEDVWSKPLSYCKSVKDSFCLTQPHSHWEKSIPRKQWIDYLNKHPEFDSADSLSKAAATNYFPTEKSLYFADSIPLKQIRADMGLRSTFFTIYEDGEEVKFTGKGFGHGVGLCQEGAMKMAELGWKYNDILHFYYSDVHFLHLSVLEFFRD